MGRFINADGYVSTGQGIIGNNMYAYCNNNPVNMSDSSGTIPTFAAKMTDGGTQTNALKAAIRLYEWAESEGINFYSSEMAAVEAWAKKYRPLSEEYEYVSYIYELHLGIGYMPVYYYTNAYKGMKEKWFISDNCIFGTLTLEYLDTTYFGDVVAHIHSHPDPGINPETGKRRINDFPSFGKGLKGGDRIAMNLFGYREMYIIPYYVRNHPIVIYSDQNTWGIRP